MESHSRVRKGLGQRNHDRSQHGEGEAGCIFTRVRSWFKVPAEPRAMQMTLQSPLCSERQFAVSQVEFIKPTCRLL